IQLSRGRPPSTASLDVEEALSSERAQTDEPADIRTQDLGRFSDPRSAVHRVLFARACRARQKSDRLCKVFRAVSIQCLPKPESCARCPEQCGWPPRRSKVRAEAWASPVKYTGTRDVLADAVTWATKTLPNRPSAPVLAGILISAEAGGTVRLAVFDYEVSSRVEIAADVVSAGTVLVSGR